MLATDFAFSSFGTAVAHGVAGAPSCERCNPQRPSERQSEASGESVGWHADIASMQYEYEAAIRELCSSITEARVRRTLLYMLSYISHVHGHLLQKIQHEANLRSYQDARAEAAMSVQLKKLLQDCRDEPAVEAAEALHQEPQKVAVMPSSAVAAQPEPAPWQKMHHTAPQPETSPPEAARSIPQEIDPRVLAQTDANRASGQRLLAYLQGQQAATLGFKDQPSGTLSGGIPLQIPSPCGRIERLPVSEFHHQGDLSNDESEQDDLEAKHRKSLEVARMLLCPPELASQQAYPGSGPGPMGCQVAEAISLGA